MESGNKDRLNQLRHEIDRLDKSLIHVLAERFDVVEAIGECKLVNGIPIHDPDRESRLIEGFRGRLGENAHKDAIERIYKYLMATSREVQAKKPLRIALLGREGANSHAALKRIASVSIDTLKMTGVEASHFEHAIGMVLDGETDGALLPIENAITGSIPAVYEALAGGNLMIVAETSLEISHVLAGNPGVRKGEIKRVLSHPQALEQCMDYLVREGIAPEAVESTVHGIEVIRSCRQMDVGVITTPEAAKNNGLDVLDSNISRYSKNVTRFVLLRKKSAEAKCLRHDGRTWKTMVTMTLTHTCGTLARALTILADKGLNLVRIESRPIPEKPFEYRFFLEIEAVCDFDMGTLMNALCDETASVEILGTYPVIGVDNITN